jgi:hypothetical protein
MIASTALDRRARSHSAQGELLVLTLAADAAAVRLGLALA